MLYKLQEGQISSHKVTAWCPCTGLIAYPAPQSRFTANTPEQQEQQPVASTSTSSLLSTTGPPSIHLTLPPLPSSSDNAPSTSFILELPEAPGAVLRGGTSAAAGHEYISHLSFSPDGNYLAVFTSYNSESTSLTKPEDNSIRFVLFHRGDEINTWTCAFDWDSKRAKANLTSPETAAVPTSSSVRLDAAGILDVRWLQTEASSFGRTPASSSSDRKRGHDTMLDFSGALSLAAVLQSNELLLIHLPYQAIQPQVYVASLQDTSITTQDISMFGTSFSALPVPMPMGGDPGTSLLNGALDSLGMNLAGSVPFNAGHLQSNMTSFTSADKAKESRLGTIGACTTTQQYSTTPDAPPALTTEFLVAFQEAHQPVMYRQAGKAPGNDASLQNDTTGMLLDGVNLTMDDSDNTNKTFEHNPGGMDVIQQPNAISGQVSQQQTVNHNLGLSDYNGYGQSSGFGSGYGEINLSALDELFDNDFGTGGAGMSNGDSTMGGLSSTLDSINQDFASTFASATEPDGAPSPTKKESKDTPQAQLQNGNNGQSSFDAATHRSESPSKSMLDGTYGSGSRGSSPRKGHGSNGEDELPELMDGAMDGSRAEALAQIRLSQVKIEWTEYGLLSLSVNPAFTITSQTGAVLDGGLTPPSVVTHLQFVPSPSGETSRLLAISVPLSETQEHRSSRVQIYDISQEPFMLSDAFMTLEGRKADPDLALLESQVEWVVKPVQAENLDWLERGTVLDVRCGREEMTAVMMRAEGTLELITSKWTGDRADYSATMPCYYPISFAASPSNGMAIACALEGNELPFLRGVPVLFKLRADPRTKSENSGEGEDRKDQSSHIVGVLASSLIHGLAARRSVRDVLLSAANLRTDMQSQFLRVSWETASNVVQGAKVEQTRLLWPLLAIQRRMQSGPSSGILDDILQLSACLRVMQGNKATLRHASQQSTSQHQVNEVFEGDAVWPIIGHISWLFELWDKIILTMTSDELDKDWSSASFLIMHPLPRMLQQRLIRLIARFANYMMNLKEGAALVSTPADPTTAVLDTELAKTVLGDIIVGQRQKTQEWNNMLQGLANKLGSEWTDNITKGRESLITLTLPPELERTAREMAFGMKQKLLPLVVKAKKRDRAESLDVIAGTLLKVDAASYRICTLCAGKTQLFLGTKGSEWEYSKKRSCICGGQWVAA
ncbi:hypothetical protein P389DRAFT_81018 [Cystobasidium minutum MCA 4210]|uniref:uncharacterized protein n=1 Tax=Cystobasidium minutum MCA 4210 TaxID=1397322 RepID=UPI0034CD2C8D|eukprot:jgi/Rhomi1/81018/CE81017_609